MDTGFIYALGAAITWGLVYALDQKILVGIAPVTLVFIDSIFAAMIMLPFVIFRHGSFKEIIFAGKSNWTLILLLAFFTALANFLILSGIKNLDASRASVIEIAYPFFVVLFSYILFRSTPNMFFFIGAFFVFAGCVIIIKFA